MDNFTANERTIRFGDHMVCLTRQEDMLLAVSYLPDNTPGGRPATRSEYALPEQVLAVEDPVAVFRVSPQQAWLMRMKAIRLAWLRRKHKLEY